MNVNYFMKEALIEARKALTFDETPIGAILVDNISKKIVSRGFNQINKLNNAMMHCEISIILETCQKLKLKYLDNMTMFVTLEPCSMCASAISEVHIKSLYFGAYDEKNGGIEKIRVAFKRNNIFMPNIIGGIMEKECSKLIKEYFVKKR
jgi:tRNA(adenine34) deaminase